MLHVLVGKDLHRWWSDRNALIVTLALPLVLTGVLGVSFGGFGGGAPELDAIPLAIVGDPPGMIRDAMDEALAETELFAPIWTDSLNADGMVRAGEVRAALVLPQDLAERIFSGEDVVVELWKDPVSVFQAAIVEQILERMVATLRAGEAAYYGAWPEDWFARPGEPDPFGDLLTADSGLEVWRRIADGTDEAEAAWRKMKALVDHQVALSDAFETPAVDLQVLARAEAKPDPAQAAFSGNLFDMILPGMGIFFLLFAAMNAAADLHREKDGGTLKRLFAAPLRPADVLLGKWVYAVGNGLLQLAVLLVAGKVLFRMNLGPEPLALPVVAFASAAMLGSLYLPLALLTRDEKQMGAVGTGLTLFLGIVGGSFIGVDQMPGFMRAMNGFAPNGWAVNAMTDVVARDQGLDAVWPEVLRLLAFAIAMLGVSLLIHRRRGGKEAWL